MKKFLSTIVTLVILSLVFPIGVFGAAQVANLPLSLNLTDVRGQLTVPLPDRASDAYVVNPDNVMVKYRGNGENLVEDSDDLTAGIWAISNFTKNTATTGTFIAQYGYIRHWVLTEEGKTYIFSFKARAITGNTFLSYYHALSATGDTTVLTLTATLTQYSIAVLGKAGGGNVGFGILDGNAAGHGQIEFTDIQVEETSVPINELEDESDYADHRISLADGQSWFGGDNLASNLFDQDGGSGGAGDKGGFNLTDLRNAELNSGNLTVGTIYEISARNTEDFTADGAPDNNVGTTFTAIGTNVTLDADDKVYPIDISWNNYGTNQVSIDSDALKIIYVDSVEGAYLNFRSAGELSSNLVIGQLYKLQIDVKVNGGSSIVLFIGGPNINKDVISTEFQMYTFYFVANSTTDNFLRVQSMSAGEIIWLDNITIQAVTSPADFADSGFLVQVTDGGGNKASGYIGEAGTGETLGIELLSNPSFDANTTGWDPGSSGAVPGLLASAAGGANNNALRIIENGNGGDGSDPYAQATVVTVLNKEYKAGVWRKQGTEATFLSYVLGLEYSNVDIGSGESTGTWVRDENNFVAGDTSSALRLRQIAATTLGTTIFFDEASFKEVTEPNLNSVMIYKTQALASQGWMIEDGFDPNDIASWEIYDNKLGDTEPRVYTPTSGGTAVIPAEAAFDSKGIVNIGPVTNWLLQSRDWTQAIWTKNNITPAYTSVGVDGVANKATRLTATAANGTAVQVLTVDGSTNSWFFWARRITGTGDVQLTDDNFSSNTVLDLTSSWRKFEINDAGSAPTVGIKIVTNTDAIDVDFGMLIERPYSVNWAIPTLSVPVTTTSQVVPWTMSTVFKGILSDAVNGSESEGTLIASWTPYYDATDVSANAGIIAVRESWNSVLATGTGSKIRAYEGTDTAYSGTTNWTANTTYTLIIRWSKRQNKLQVSVIDAGVLTNGPVISYDGAFTLGTDLIIGFGNNYPFSLGEVHFYDQWIVDSLLFKYPGFISGAAAGLWW